jgi:hypothetical protein
MKQYEIYVPLYSNEGKRLAAANFNRLKKRLVSKFGGLTYFPQKNKGFWTIGKATFHDEIVILRVISAETKTVKKFWQQLKADLQKEWQQEHVLIVAHEVRTV